MNLSVVEIFDLNEVSVDITLGTEARLTYHDVALGLHSISNSFPNRPEVSSKIVKIYLLWYRPIARHPGLCARLVKIQALVRFVAAYVSLIS